MLGLDAAGKTSILYKLHIGEVLSTVPTIGTACAQLHCRKHPIFPRSAALQVMHAMQCSDKLPAFLQVSMLKRFNTKMCCSLCGMSEARKSSVLFGDIISITLMG